MKTYFIFAMICAIVLSFVANSSFAAFPARTETTSTSVSGYHTFKQSVKEKISGYKKTTPQTTAISKTSGAFGIVSLVAGVLGLIFLFIPVLVIGFIPLAIMALVFGILGLKGSNKGLALAGLILGAVELLILILLVALFVAYFSL